MREKKKVDRPGGEDGHDAEADVGAEGPFFLAGDSTADHDHEIESETSHFRHFFYSNKFLTKTRSPRIPASPMSATAFYSHGRRRRKRPTSLPKVNLYRQACRLQNFSNAADTAAPTENRIPGNRDRDSLAFRLGSRTPDRPNL